VKKENDYNIAAKIGWHFTLAEQSGSSSMGAKRRREPQRLLPAGSKKRQKVEIAGHDSIISNRIFNIDELNWKEAQLPDRLDDAGGFFGLEEIEGVEVVRPRGKGQIKFKVCRGAKLSL
jgi:ATP-dependent RNA helicase DDX24/MAK5